MSFLTYVEKQKGFKPHAQCTEEGAAPGHRWRWQGLTTHGPAGNVPQMSVFLPLKPGTPTSILARLYLCQTSDLQNRQMTILSCAKLPSSC